MRSGGYLKDIPKPHHRKWPGADDKREVSVSISKFCGWGTHYHLSVREESNPIWDTRTQAECNSRCAGTPYGDEIVGWRSAWDDDGEEGRGFADLQTFDFRYQINDYLKWLGHEKFSPETRELIVTDNTLDLDHLSDDEYEAQRYYYRRDGD